MKFVKQINDIIKNLESCDKHLGTYELIKIGLYGSPQALYFARIHGNAPKYTKIGRSCIFSKEDVRDYIENNESAVIKRLNHKNRKEFSYLKKPYIKKLKDHLIDVIIKALKDCDV